MLARRLAAARRRRRIQIARRAATAVAGLWRRVDRQRITGSWRALAGEAEALLAHAQYLAAAGADDYTDDVTDALGVTTAPVGRVPAGALAGVAADGRSLAGLLEAPAVAALTAVGRGAPVGRAMAAGLLRLDMIVRTEVADAGRVADGIAVTARPRLGYVRMLELPSCARCIILAGRWYEWHAGFARHPRCDCTHIPAVEDTAGDLRTDPRAAFDALDAAGQDRAFTAAGARAIRDGASLSRVVNVRRGMYTAGGRRYTTTGAARRRRRGGRLMPEQIYVEAAGDRGEALRLLRLHGYLT